MNFLLEAHSGLRWLILLVGVVAVVKYLMGWLQKGNYEKNDRILGAAFTGLIDLQVLLGFVFLFWSGSSGVGYPAYRLEHTFTMILVLVLAHLKSRWKSASDEIRFRNGFLTILLALLLIIAGISRVPGGWG